MKKIVFTIFTFLTFIAFNSINAQIKTPQPSPAASVSSTVGLTNINIDYFRPGVKGREVFAADGLVPFGEVWRTGANAGTIVSFNTDITFGGKAVKAGEYQMVTIPGEDEWHVMLHTEMIGGNMNNYNEESVAAKVAVKPSKTMGTVERMTFQITDISADNTKAKIEFSWANVMWSVPVEVNFDKTVMEDIAANTKVSPQNYVQAANYYYATDKDLDQALEWMNMYLADESTQNQFWNIHLKAQILAKMGKTQEAIKVATKSMEMAKASPNGDFGYVKRNQDLIASLK